MNVDLFSEFLYYSIKSSMYFEFLCLKFSYIKPSYFENYNYTYFYYYNLKNYKKIEAILN